MYGYTSFINGYFFRPVRVAQSVARLIQRPDDPGSIPVPPHTFISPFADSRRAVVSYLRKYVHEVLVNNFGGLSLPRKSVVRLTDHPDMTLDVYCGRKTTRQQLMQQPFLQMETMSERLTTKSNREVSSV